MLSLFLTLVGLAFGLFLCALVLGNGLRLAVWVCREPVRLMLLLTAVFAGFCALYL